MKYNLSSILTQNSSHPALQFEPNFFRPRLFLLLTTHCLFLLFSSPTWAAKPHPNPWIFTKIIPQQKKIQLGESASFTLQWTLHEDYHAYYDQFKVKPLKPLDTVVKILDIRKVTEFKDPISQQLRQGVKGSGEVEISVQIPKDQIHEESLLSEIEFTYQACAEDHCLLPKKIKVPIEIQFANQEHLESHTGKSIQNFEFKLFDNVYKLEGWQMWLALFIAGVLTSLTPCIFPLIPITLAILGGGEVRRSRKRSFFLSLFYVLGIAITYSTLGLLAASTGSLFGAFLGHPAMIFFLSILFFVLGLGMLGVFQIEAPAFLKDRLLKLNTGGGYLGAFFSGLIAGVIASPCVGPVLAAILTYVAQTKNIYLGFGMLFVFAMGLGQLFLLLGTFGQIKSHLPKSGPWLNTVKWFFAFCFFALSLFYLQPLINQSGFFDSIQTQESPHKIQWIPYTEEARKAAQAQGHPIIVDIYADWCVACKELEKITFNSELIINNKQNILFFKFDATQESETFTQLQNEFGIVGLPFVIFINKSGEWEKDLTLTGFEGPEEFLKRLQKLLPNNNH